MTTRIASATPADAALCNQLEPPARGVNVGGGIHVVIPDDWQARIAAGQDVPGCSYARIDADGSLVVSDVVQAQLAVPAIAQALPAASVADLDTKLAVAVSAGTVVTDQPVNLAAQVIA